MHRSPSSTVIRRSMYRFSSAVRAPVFKEAELNKTVSEDVLRRRLKFRCKNRGIKELDLMMGNWAMDYVDTLTSDQCQELQDILNEETLDLVNILLKREDVDHEIPEKFKDNSVMNLMVEWRNRGNI